MLYSALTSVLDGGGWSKQRPGRSTPEKKPDTHSSWLDRPHGWFVRGLEKRKLLASVGFRTPDRPARSFIYIQKKL